MFGERESKNLGGEPSDEDFGKRLRKPISQTDMHTSARGMLARQFFVRRLANSFRFVHPRTCRRWPRFANPRRRCLITQPSTVNEKCNTTQLRIFQFTMHAVGAFLTRAGRPPPHSPPRSRSEIAGRGSDGRGGGDGSRDGCGSLREPSGRASERDLGRSTCSNSDSSTELEGSWGFGRFRAPRTREVRGRSSTGSRPRRSARR